jgi:arylsulfatase A-like enzyme
MSRLVRFVAILAIAMATVGAWPMSESSGESSLPNIVIILTDDQRVGLVDAMPVVTTQIKQLGTNFTHYMVPTSLCCPSRASLLTGKFSHGTGVWNNALPPDPPLSGGQGAFVANGNEPETLAAVLDPVGYRTVLIGKYLNGYKSTQPTPQGWDVFQAFSPYPGYYYDFTLDGTYYGTAPEDYSTDVIADRAVSQISQTGDEPLFLYLAPYAPHPPYTPAPRYENKDVSSLIGDRDFGAFNEANVADKPHWVRRLPLRSFSQVEHTATLQHRAVMAVDDLAQRVIAELEAQGMLDNTLLIFASDNGYQWGEHRYTGKNVAYRRATEVPLIIRWDGHITPGTVDAAVRLNVDVTATIAEAAGVDMPWSEGHSVLTSQGRRGFVLEATRQYPPTPVRPAYCGWRTLNRLYVRYANGEEELYLYKSDPLEETNVAGLAKYDEILTSMRESARQACVPVPPGFTWTP